MKAYGYCRDDCGCPCCKKRAGKHKRSRKKNDKGRRKTERQKAKQHIKNNGVPGDSHNFDDYED